MDFIWLPDNVKRSLAPMSLTEQDLKKKKLAELAIKQMQFCNSCTRTRPSFALAGVASKEVVCFEAE